MNFNRLAPMLFLVVSPQWGVASEGTNARAAAQLKSRDPEVASMALRSLYEAGEAAIPELLRLRGSAGEFFGSLRSCDPGGFVIDAADPAQKPTVEIAAIYLICAIYERNYCFSCIRLVDESRGPDDIRFVNHIAAPAAWRSVLGWEEARSRQGLEALRKQKLDPLSGCKYRFW